MTCFKPIIAWQYKQMPINANKDEETLKKYRKIYFHKLKDGQQIEIPCGRCIGCRLDHANMWATRIVEETKKWKHAIFVTLTYAEHKLRQDGTPTLPRTKEGYPTLSKRDVQLFLKRLRKQEKGIEAWENPKTHKIEYPIRYFYCGEYGQKNTKRSHYHMIIWNWTPNDLKYYKNSDGSNEALYTSKKLEKLWGLGFCPIGNVTYESACYVARYVQKKAGIPAKKREYEDYTDENGNMKSKIKKEIGPIPEFICMSRGVGIGRTAWDTDKEKFKRNNGIPTKTKETITTKPIPRYFKKLWEKENMAEFDTWRYKMKKIALQTKEKLLKCYNFGQMQWNADTTVNNQKMTELEIKSKKLKRPLDNS